MLKRLTWMLIVTLLTTITVIAQNSITTKPESTPLPTVDEVLDKYVKALGGKEAVEKVSSRVEKGSLELEGMGLSGPVEVYAKAPNKTVTVIDLSGFGKIVRTFDGEKGYVSDPMSGLRELSGAELATDKRNADFYGMLNSRKNFSKLEIKGKEKVGSSDAYVVVATPAVGDAEKHYFAADTGLLVRVDSKSETPQGKLSFETYFSDYKEVDGIKIAHLVRQVSSAFIAVIKLSEVKHNVEVADAKFAKPAGQ
jgi:hypothetical protein